MAEGKANCNPDPSVSATFVASNPVTQPPSASPQYISEADVLARARSIGANNAAAPARAILMSYRDAVAMDNNLANNGIVNRDRKVWVITVHGRVMDRGSLRFPMKIHDVYTIIVDAETNTMTDICYGCATVNLQSN